MTTLGTITNKCIETHITSAVDEVADSSGAEGNSTQSNFNFKFEIGDKNWSIPIPTSFGGLVNLFKEGQGTALCIASGVADARTIALESFQKLLITLDPLETEDSSIESTDWSLIADKAPQLVLEKVEDKLTKANSFETNDFLSKERLAKIMGAHSDEVWNRFFKEKLEGFEAMSPESQWALLFCLHTYAEGHKNYMSDEVLTAYYEAVSNGFLENFKLGENTANNFSKLIALSIANILPLESNPDSRSLARSFWEDIGFPAIEDIDELTNEEDYGTPLNERILTQSIEIENILNDLSTTFFQHNHLTDRRDGDAVDMEDDILELMFEIRLARRNTQINQDDYTYWENEPTYGLMSSKAMEGRGFLGD